ncbi:polysaccharide biosynthesis tyrosine autokinase [Massilia sp. 2TAF26]|uniref:polysaccharide biosynthesis tyrosine autokinase n=1 Tax=Massilia sp. 2TAF26 TaxID=3233012 RepID=UPI003F95E69A
MSTVREHRALIQVNPRSPILGEPFDAAAEGAQWESPFDLKSGLSALYSGRWLIVWITAIVTLSAMLYTLTIKPVFEADMTLYVEEESPNASKNMLSEASSLFETKKAPIAEMELLRSRMVVSRAVDNLKLYIDVEPKYFPLVGAWIANKLGNDLSNPGLFGYGGYVWGKEKADVSLFEVPEAWHGRQFTLTALDGQRYRFSGGGQRTVFDGTVGQRYQVPTPQGMIELKVDRMSARPGAMFVLRRTSLLSTTAAIQNALVVAEHGKQSGVIEVKLQGDSARRTYLVLSEIGREYMRQNLARKAEAAEKSLAFLNEQLPILKNQLEQAEDRYTRFRNAHSTVDLNEEARVNLAQVAAARARRTDLIQKKAELLARLTENHPQVEAIDLQRKEVDAELARAEARIKGMPVLEQDEARLTREIKVNTELYVALSNSAQQLRLATVGQVSNVRMVDMPIPPEQPIKPNRPLIVALAAVTGLFLGSVAAFARKAIKGGIDDEQKIERMLRARAVYALIPHSNNQDKLMHKAQGGGSVSPILATVMPEDPAVESLRSFRAALLFSLPHFKNNIVMFTGPTHGVGKSFVTANLAAVIAASGRSVLLVDTDMRSGNLCNYLGVNRERGLSSAILGKASIDEVIHHGLVDKLDFIPTGELPPNDPEFLLHPNFGHLLKQASSRYDLVLLDSPPLLAGADALIIGAQAGAVFMVARFSRTKESEINESINHLNRAGIPLEGVLLNDMAPRLGTYGSYPRSAAI